MNSTVTRGGSPPDTCDILNTLVRMHGRSLANYMHSAHPCDAERHPGGMRIVEHIVADQHEMMDRFAEEILSRGGLVQPGGYPASFTSLHDLSFRYMLKRLIEHQRRDVQVMEGLLPSLQHDTKAHILAEEALGAAKAHLDTLLDHQDDASGDRKAVGGE